MRGSPGSRFPKGRNEKVPGKNKAFPGTFWPSTPQGVLAISDRNPRLENYCLFLY